MSQKVNVNDLKRNTDFSPLHDYLRNADRKSEIEIILKNNIGGCVYQGSELIQAIEKTKATVTIVVSGSASSMAANVWIYFYVKRLPRIKLAFEDKKAFLLIHSPRLVENSQLNFIDDIEDVGVKEQLKFETVRFGLLLYDFVKENKHFIFTKKNSQAPITNEEAFNLFINNQDLIVRDKRLYQSELSAMKG